MKLSYLRNLLARYGVTFPDAPDYPSGSYRFEFGHATVTIWVHHPDGTQVREIGYRASSYYGFCSQLNAVEVLRRLLSSPRSLFANLSTMAWLNFDSRGNATMTVRHTKDFFKTTDATAISLFAAYARGHGEPERRVFIDWLLENGPAGLAAILQQEWSNP